jgi:hypothetical protein
MTLLETLILAKYDQCIEADDFGYYRRNGGIRSIREFIDDLAEPRGRIGVRRLHNAFSTYTPLRDLNQTFADLLKIKIGSGQPEDLDPASDLVSMLFCDTPLIKLPSHALEDADPAIIEQALKEAGLRSASDLPEYLALPSVWEHYLKLLYDRLVKQLSGRKLMSFFMQPRNSAGFYRWHPDMAIGKKRIFRQPVLEIGDRTLTVKVVLHKQDDETFTRYDWNASLATHADKPEAVACGQVFIFERRDGAPARDLANLFMGSESVPGLTIPEMRDFFEQVPDAVYRVTKNDLCIVTAWERHQDAEPGCGKVLMESTIACLRKMFATVQTIAIESTPLQFRVWGKESDPAMVESAKLDALDALTAYVSELNFPKATTETIYSHVGEAYKKLLAVRPAEPEVEVSSSITPVTIVADQLHDVRNEPAVSVASSPNAGQDEGTGGRQFEDFIANPEDLPDLLRLAGLPALAADIESGTVEMSEVLRVLAELFIYRRVPYLPLSFSPRINMEKLVYFDMVEKLAVPRGLEQSLIEFRKTLPEDINYIGVVHCADQALDEWVVVVQAVNRFGVMTGYFTLARVPAYIDVGRYLR